MREGTQMSERLFERIDFSMLVPEDVWTGDEEVDIRVDQLLRYANEQMQLADEQKERNIERLTRGD